jgi:DNA-directed RNA polymerase specialized sigma24 family protein
VRERSALARFGRESSTPSEGVDALSALISAERASVVRAALSALADDDRELLTLMYFEGLDAWGVAARFGLTVSAVRVRKHRALHRLAVLLGESDGNESPASGTPE